MDSLDRTGPEEYLPVRRRNRHGLSGRGRGMTRSRTGRLLAWSLLAMLPGCYPFEQEHVRPDVELFPREELPQRETSPYHPRPDPPVPRIAAEQEAVDPRLTIVER